MPGPGEKIFSQDQQTCPQKGTEYQIFITCYAFQKSIIHFHTTIFNFTFFLIWVIWEKGKNWSVNNTKLGTKMVNSYQKVKISAD